MLRRADLVAMIAIVAIGCAITIAVGERIGANHGQGWDGQMYASWGDNLSALVRARELDAFQAHRVLPSAIVHVAVRAGAGVIGAFQLLDALALIAAAVLLGRIAVVLAWTRRAAWVAFAAVVLGFANAREALYYPTMTDPSAFALALAIVWAYVARRPIALWIALLASAFTWPAMLALGTPLLVLPRRRSADTSSPGDARDTDQRNARAPAEPTDGKLPADQRDARVPAEQTDDKLPADQRDAQARAEQTDGKLPADQRDARARAEHTHDKLPADQRDARARTEHKDDDKLPADRHDPLAPAEHMLDGKEAGESGEHGASRPQQAFAAELPHDPPSEAALARRRGVLCGIVAAVVVGLIFADVLADIDQPQIARWIARSWRTLWPLTIALTVLGCGAAAYFVGREPRTFALRTYAREVGIVRIALGAAGVVAVIGASAAWTAIAANANQGFGLVELEYYYVATALRGPAWNVVHHVVYWGPIVIVAIAAWPRIAAQAAAWSPGCAIVLGGVALAWIAPDARHLLHFMPFIVVIAVTATQAWWTRRATITFVVASVAWSKLWLPIHYDTVHDSYAWPDLRFFMQHAPWASDTTYAAHLAALAVTALALSIAVRRQS
jgi:hypothetical protein